MICTQTRSSILDRHIISKRFRNVYGTSGILGMFIKTYVQQLLVADHLIALFQEYANLREIWKLPVPLNVYFQSVVPPPEGTGELNYVTESELLHYQFIFKNLGLRETALYEKKKEGQVYALLMGLLVCLRSVPNNSWGL